MSVMVGGSGAARSCGTQGGSSSSGRGPAATLPPESRAGPDRSPRPFSLPLFPPHAAKPSSPAATARHACLPARAPDLQSFRADLAESDLLRLSSEGHRQSVTAADLQPSFLADKDGNIFAAGHRGQRCWPAGLMRKILWSPYWPPATSPAAVLRVQPPQAYNSVTFKIGYRFCGMAADYHTTTPCLGLYQASRKRIDLFRRIYHINRSPEGRRREEDASLVCFQNIVLLASRVVNLNLLTFVSGLLRVDSSSMASCGMPKQPVGKGCTVLQ